MAVNVTSKAAQTMFSSAVAHGITPRTVATWSSLIPRTPRVLVPIQLDALVIRPDGAQQTYWADCRMKDPPSGATTAAAAIFSAPPFTDKSATRRQGFICTGPCPMRSPGDRPAAATLLFLPFPIAGLSFACIPPD